MERFATFHDYYLIGVYTPLALTLTFLSSDSPGISPGAIHIYKIVITGYHAGGGRRPDFPCRRPLLSAFLGPGVYTAVPYLLVSRQTCAQCSNLLQSGAAFRSVHFSWMLPLLVL